MMGVFRGLAALLALMLFVGAADARVPAKREGVWAQSYVDRQPDPAICFGTLPNGLRYAILKNNTPVGQLSMRLVIKAGSLDEPVGSEGIAHFLEHMAFRGSAHVADGDVMHILQRAGLSPGADTNAATGAESTTYQFDFPQGGKANLDQGLMLFREIAGELTIDPKAVEVERGVVLSEERLRDGPQFRAVKAMLGFSLQGQLAPDRLPIGKTDVVAHADAGQIRRFYQTEYRPDNAAVVVVGDVDPAEAEAAIRAKFGDWKAKAPPPRAPDLGSPLRRGSQARLFSEPGAPTNTQIVWTRPYDDRADTSERMRDDFNRFAGLIVLNRRMGDIARMADAPFIGAGFGQNNLMKSANTTSLIITATADRQLSAMRAAVDEQRRIVRYGVTQPEFDRALQALNAVFSAAVNGASTRPSAALANGIARDVVDDEVTRAPAQDYADFQSWSHFVKLKDVDQAVKAAFEGSGPLLFLSAPQPPAGGEKALAAAFDQANRDQVTAPAAAAVPGWPYTSFGAPGHVAERKEIADLGLTTIAFDNGVRLIVKPTDFAKGQVLMSVGFGQGRLGLPANRAQAYWMVSGRSAFVDGGTGKVTAGDIQKIMASRLVGVRLDMADNAFELVGATRPEDLPTELQLATAYLNDPGFRPEAVTRIQNELATLLPQLDATPNAVLVRALDPLLHSGDPRWTAYPSAEQLAASRPQDLILLLENALSGPVTVTLVGDVTVDQAIASVAATLGALPSRGPHVAAPSGGIAFPAPNGAPIRLTHTGRADQAIAVAAWKAGGFWTAPKDARALQVLSAVIRQRLFDTIREREGATYSPNVGAVNSTTVDGYGYLIVSVEMPPEKMAAFTTALDTVIADLAAKPLTADELERARKPTVEARARDRQSNGYWLQTLAAAHYDAREYDAIRTRVSGVEQVSAADIQRVAATYLAKAKPWRLEVVPASAK